MMADEKALRSALNLQRYCAERGCDPAVCIFRTDAGVCVLQQARIPENIRLDDIRTGQRHEPVSDGVS